MAIDGDTIVATAPGDDVGSNVDQGSAYTFTRTGVNRTQTAKLTASDGAAGDLLGGPGAGSVQGIAIGDEILVGAPNQDVSGNDDQGEVYRFARTGSDRFETGKLTDPDPGEFDLFGWSVAADGPLALAGSINDTTGAGGCCHGSATVFFEGGGGSDTTPPDTEITKGPPNRTTKTKAKFEFTGTDDASAAGDLTFECSLDGKPFADCTSPTTYKNLKRDKKHTFEVRATDEADNTDPSPAEDAWKVKK